MDALAAAEGLSLDEAQAAVLAEVQAALVAEAPRIAEATEDEADAFGAALLALWEALVKRFPKIDRSWLQTWLQIFTAILLAQWAMCSSEPGQQRVEQRLEQHGVALTDLRAAVEDMAEQSAPLELVALKPRPVRANPEAEAKQLGMLPEGARVIVLEAQDRWRYVRVVRLPDGTASTLEGWVFLRDLRPDTRRHMR